MMYQIKFNGRIFYARDRGTTVRINAKDVLKQRFETAGQLIRRLYPDAEIYPIGTTK